MQTLDLAQVIHFIDSGVFNAVQTTSLIDMRNNVSVENALYFYVANNVPKVYVNGVDIITGSSVVLTYPLGHTVK